MADKRGLRQKDRVVYAISDDSDATESPSAVSSAFSTPQKQKQKRVRSIIDLDDDDDDIKEIESPKTPPPRVTSAGHSLRQHSSLNLSLRAQENGDKPVKKKRKLSKQRARNIPKISSDLKNNALTTVRSELRQSIATETAGKRAKFFVAKKDFFLPLLPENNHVKKLVEQHESNVGQDATIIPYEAIEKQPLGYVRQYDLSSFWIYTK